MREVGITRAGEPNMTNKLLSVRQVADLLCISERSIFRLVDAAKMPKPIRLGRAIRWNREEVETWIASGCRASLSQEILK